MPEPSYPGEFKERVTAEDIAKINKALEASGGNRAAAAEIIGMAVGRLTSAVNSNPALSARWHTNNDLLDGKTNINPITAINRTPPKPLDLAPSQKMAIELTVGEKKLNRSLAKLGFKSAEIQAISSVEEFAGQHFEETLSIMHGGLLKSAMRLMLLAERIEQTYLQEDDLEPKERDFWWKAYFEILEKLRSMNEQTNKAALTKALIEMKRKESEGGNPRGKPGFQPLSAVQINVNGAKEVTVTPSDPNSSQ